MISLDDITVAYGSYVLLDKINFQCTEKFRSVKIGFRDAYGGK